MMRRKEHVLRRRVEKYCANYTFHQQQFSQYPSCLLSQFSILCTHTVQLLIILTILASFTNHHYINCVNDFSIASLTVNGNNLVPSNDNSNNEQFLGRCLECICEASSGCQINNSKRCESYYCGAYQLSYTYWADSGATTTQKKSPSRISGPKATIGDHYVTSLSVSPKDFEQCALDKNCSARTVKNYFLKYLKDCDGDNRITCADMASIHRAGADICNADWLYKTKFWSAFSKSECYVNLNNSNHNQQSARLSNRLPVVSVIVSGNRSRSTAGSPIENTRDPRGAVVSINENIGAEINLNHRSNGTLRGSGGNQTRPVLVSTRSASNFPLRNNNNDDLFDRFSPNNFFSSINDNLNDNSDSDATSFLDRFAVTNWNLQQQQQIDKQCLNCICEAQSNCDLSGRNCRFGNVCGPFSITPGYWNDASKPGLDWLTCTRTRDCSEMTVRNYMQRYKRDCDNDGRITCLDYGAIHHLGGAACTQMSALSAGDKYFERFNRCLERQARGGARINITTATGSNTNQRQPTTIDRPADINNNPANRFVVASSSGGSLIKPPITNTNNGPPSSVGASASTSNEFPRIPSTSSSNPNVATALTNTLNHLPAIQPEIMNSIPQLPRRLTIGQSGPPTNNRNTNRNTRNELSSTNNNRLPSNNNNNNGEETSRDDVTIEFETRDVFSSTSRRITNEGTPIRDTDHSSGFVRNSSGVVRGASLEEVYPRIPALVADIVTPKSDLSDDTNFERLDINNNNNNENPSTSTTTNNNNNRQPPTVSVDDTNGNGAPINTNEDTNNPASVITNPPLITTLDDATAMSNSGLEVSSVSDESVSATSDTTSTTLWPTGSGVSSFNWPDHNQPIANPLAPTFTSRIPTPFITSDNSRRTTTSSLSSSFRPSSTTTTTATTTTTTTTTPRPTTTSTTSTTTARPSSNVDIERLSPEPEYPRPPITVDTRARLRVNEARTEPLSESLEISEISRRSEPTLPTRERTGSFETISLDEPFSNENENKSSLNSPFRLDRPDRRLLANRASSRKITTECFECICEASTSCDLKSRCQTSDVKHTRCGMYLISYDQWLESGLSKTLTSPEAISRDPAADERAFYDCVTNQGCAEKVLNLYMDKRLRDCDGDGRINCYDVAAIHRAGPINCHSEAFLETQYWGDFNACYGFNQAFKRRR